MEFDSLARYAPTYVADMTDRMHRYIVGLDQYYVGSCLVMAAQTGMDIARIQAHTQGMEDRRRGRQPDGVDDRGQPKRARSSGYSGDFLGRQPPQQQSKHPPQSVRGTPRSSPAGDQRAQVIQGQARVLGFQAHSWTEAPAVRQNHLDLRVLTVEDGISGSALASPVLALCVVVRVTR